MDNTWFHMDNYFRHLQNLNFKVVNDYPGFYNIISCYRERLAQAANTPLVFEKGPESQVYTQKVHLVENDYYFIVWVISYAEEVIKKHGIPVESFPVEPLIQAVNLNAINKDHSSTLLNERPIIIAQYFFLDPWHIVLDGNHRVYHSYRDEQKEILAYSLSPIQHLEAMAGEPFRTLYKIHSNLLLISRYMAGIIPQSSLEEYLLPL